MAAYVEGATVPDLIEFLSRLPPDTRLEPDRDGWLADEIKASNPQELIRRRGLFSIGNGCLIINN